MGMSEFTPAEIPTAGHELDASSVSIKQDTSSHVADKSTRE
jgi:hypothetical protein